ncbi:MAG TPA: hypothetical protein VND94_15535 [Terriglobia bacterium]|nr:hypothetical protein [Terriglobia bacterium]
MNGTWLDWMSALYIEGRDWLVTSYATFLGRMIIHLGAALLITLCFGIAGRLVAFRRDADDTTHSKTPDPETVPEGRPRFRDDDDTGITAPMA